jgi:hypothetical protein
MTGSSLSTEDGPAVAALRELASAVRRLYVLAGKPSYRVVSDLTTKDRTYPLAISHDTVRVMVMCQKIPRWQSLDSLARVLLALCVEQVDTKAEIQSLYQLWRKADDPSSPDTEVPQPAGTRDVPFVLDTVKPDDDIDAVYGARVEGRPLLVFRSPHGVAEINDYGLAMQFLKTLGGGHD